MYAMQIKRIFVRYELNFVQHSNLLKESCSLSRAVHAEVDPPRWDDFGAPYGS
jgi:hypothetical protein